MMINTNSVVCGSKKIEFGSGSRILAQFGSGSGSRVMLSILKEVLKIILEKNNYRYLYCSDLAILFLTYRYIVLT